MNKYNQYVNELTRKINRLEKELEQVNTDLKRRIDGVHHSIMSFGLAKDAEKITVIHAKLEELYNMQDAFNSIFDKELGE